jgi:hypothetical protein
VIAVSERRVRPHQSGRSCKHKHGAAGGFHVKGREGLFGVAGAWNARSRRAIPLHGIRQVFFQRGTLLLRLGNRSPVRKAGRTRSLFAMLERIAQVDKVLLLREFSLVQLENKLRMARPSRSARSNLDLLT